MVDLLKKIFTWWNGATLGTLFFTKRQGVKIGEDEYGNTYYEARKAVPGYPKRRWVIYNGVAEASRVPVDWHGWLHHTFDVPPSEKPLARQPWEKDHMPNMSGTPLAYRPPGSLAEGAARDAATGDYEAWQPE